MAVYGGKLTCQTTYLWDVETNIHRNPTRLNKNYVKSTHTCPLKYLCADHHFLTICLPLLPLVLQTSCPTLTGDEYFSYYFKLVHLFSLETQGILYMHYKQEDKWRGGYCLREIMLGGEGKGH